MIIETRRAFIRRLVLITAGAASTACEGFFEDLQNLEKVKLARKLFTQSGETLIPVPEIGDTRNSPTSFGNGRLEIELPLTANGLVIPALFGGRVIAWNHSHNPDILSRIKIEGEHMTWQLQTYGLPLPDPGSEVHIGQPLVSLDFSTFVPRSRTNEFYDNPMVFIKGWKNGQDEKDSFIGVVNLSLVDGKLLKIKALRF